jgi:Uma2 family endonuclease
MSLTSTDRVTEETYRQLALGNTQLELHHGQLREKPGMSVEHNDVWEHLLAQLFRQLDRNNYRLRANFGRLRRATDTYYIPDVAIIPAAMVQALRQQPGSLDAYNDPLPLVVEIWSPSTGSYDIRAKLPDYQHRGDLEIWFIHPYEHTLTAWRRHPDGAYTETVYQGGEVRVASLPGIAINLEDLFAD